MNLGVGTFLIVRSSIKVLPLLVFLGIFSGCIGGSSPLDILDPIGIGEKDQSTRRGGAASFSNDHTTVEDYYGRILADNFFSLNGNSIDKLDENTDFNRLLNLTPVFITKNSRLQESCPGKDLEGYINICYETSANTNDLPLAYTNKRWAFDTGSSEFLQVNSFYHGGLLIKKYHSLLLDIYNNKAQPATASALNYQTAIPQKLYQNYAHWYGDRTLKTYADCDVKDNAFFSASTMSICLGYLSSFKNIKVAQDPTVLYHELGHAFTQMIQNMRNVANGGSSLPHRTDIGYFFYDEAGAINEGVADFLVHYMNGRTRVFEWVFGRFLGGARPIAESDDLHTSMDSNGKKIITTDEESRLSYPDFINYINNGPEVPLEDVHAGGMIISHFLTAFSRDIKATCSMNQETAVQTTFYLLMETYAELGDLTSTANDQLARPTINHSKDLDTLGIPTSLDWVSKVTPINFRSFSQKFAKYAYQILTKNDRAACNGVNYPLDQLERLLDSYGLLLFENYNENGNHFDYGIQGETKSVNPLNRLKTVLVDKDLIKLDERPDKSTAFVFDKRSDMLSALKGLLSSGNVAQISTKIDGELVHNNGNGQISPGELVGVALKLYNNSNSEMGGIQVLANDWDHIKIDGTERKPCNTFEDNWPLLTEGAADSTTENASNAGACGFTTRLNGNSNASTGGVNPSAESNEVLHPICFVQVDDGGASKWASQDIFRQKIELEKKDCLGGENDPHSCFIRAVRGADAAWFSRISPKSNWGETLADENGSPPFNSHNIVFFEANPNIPPGTTFNCRFRVRFTNCRNCWSDQTRDDKDDYRDFEYSGANPFKILHYQFTVID